MPQSRLNQTHNRWLKGDRKWIRIRGSYHPRRLAASTATCGLVDSLWPARLELDRVQRRVRRCQLANLALS